MVSIGFFIRVLVYVALVILLAGGLAYAGLMLMFYLFVQTILDPNTFLYVDLAVLIAMTYGVYKLWRIK